MVVRARFLFSSPLPERTVRLSAPRRTCHKTKLAREDATLDRSCRPLERYYDPSLARAGAVSLLSLPRATPQFSAEHRISVISGLSRFFKTTRKIYS